MKIGEYIKEFRKKHDMTMQEFADKSGLSKGYISMLERGKHPQSNRQLVPSINTFGKVAAAMGISVDELIANLDADQIVDLKHESQNTDYFIVPVLGRIPAGVPREMVPDVIGHEKLFRSEFRDDEDKYFCLQISGHSMEPNICDGDTVVIHEQKDAADGKIVIARVNHEDATCKRLKKYHDSIALVPINPNYDPLVFSNKQIVEEPVEILGVVKELRRKI